MCVECVCRCDVRVQSIMWYFSGVCMFLTLDFCVKHATDLVAVVVATKKKKRVVSLADIRAFN